VGAKNGHALLYVIWMSAYYTECAAAYCIELEA
jgi:hypothetical protein